MTTISSGRRRKREACGLSRVSPTPKIGGEGGRATANPFRASGVHGVDGVGDGEAGSDGVFHCCLWFRKARTEDRKEEERKKEGKREVAAQEGKEREG